MNKYKNLLIAITVLVTLSLPFIVIKYNLSLNKVNVEIPSPLDSVRAYVLLTENSGYDTVSYRIDDIDTIYTLNSVSLDSLIMKVYQKNISKVDTMIAKLSVLYDETTNISIELQNLCNSKTDLIELQTEVRINLLHLTDRLAYFKVLRHKCENDHLTFLNYKKTNNVYRIINFTIRHRSRSIKIKSALCSTFDYSILPFNCQ